MTDDKPTPDQVQDAVTRVAGEDPSNTDPIKLTAALDPDDDIYAFVNDDPAPAPVKDPITPAADGTTGDQG